MKCSNARIFTMAVVSAFVLGIAPTAKAQVNRGCSNVTLNGTYARTDSGFVTAPPAIAGPLAGVSTVNFDGNGGTSGAGMSSLNGNISSSTFTGTYTVNSDCTGTYTTLSNTGRTSTAFFVIADNGNELHIVVTSPNTVLNCTARKLYPGRII